jgi:hypothetical protein
MNKGFDEENVRNIIQSTDATLTHTENVGK